MNTCNSKNECLDAMKLITLLCYDIYLGLMREFFF